LELIGIVGLIQNDFNSGMMAGFFGGSPSAVDLYVLESDLEKAESFIREFSKLNN
jgi:hypothetical protein